MDRLDDRRKVARETEGTPPKTAKEFFDCFKVKYFYILLIL